MITQIERASLLKKLHIKGDPLLLFNIWDAGSARAIQDIGAKVIATSSWAVAAAHGCDDGEKLPFDLALANLKRIVACVDLPVTFDLESGYGQSANEIQIIFSKVIEAGAVGINFEDQIIDKEDLYSIEDQCTRIKAIHELAVKASIPIFINARTDIFLKTDWPKHNDTHLEEAIHRASAYAQSGATGFFAPGLTDAQYIEKLCKHSPIPINIMVMPNTPSLKELSKLGVARISFGPGPYHQAMNALKETGQKAYNELTSGK